MNKEKIARVRSTVESTYWRERRLSRRLRRLRNRPTFTPEQNIILQSIKVTALRFELSEDSLLFRNLDELARALDAWASSNRPNTRSIESVHENGTRLIREWG